MSKIGATGYQILRAKAPNSILLALGLRQTSLRELTNAPQTP